MKVEVVLPPEVVLNKMFRGQVNLTNDEEFEAEVADVAPLDDAVETIGQTQMFIQPNETKTVEIKGVMTELRKLDGRISVKYRLRI